MMDMQLFRYVSSNKLPGGVVEEGLCSLLGSLLWRSFLPMIHRLPPSS